MRSEMISAVCSSNGCLSCERGKQDTSLSGRNMGSTPLHTTNTPLDEKKSLLYDSRDPGESTCFALASLEYKKMKKDLVD